MQKVNLEILFFGWIFQCVPLSIKLLNDPTLLAACTFILSCMVSNYTFYYTS